MRKVMICLGLTAVVACCSVQVAQADDLAGLKDQVRAVQKQIQEQAEQIERQERLILDLRQQIESLEKVAGHSKSVGKNPTNVPSPRPSQVEAGYRKGLYLKTLDDQYALRFRFLIQPQYEFLDVDGGGNTSTFLIKRAQLRMFGNVLGPRLKYKMMLQGRTTTAGDDNVDLRDLWLDWQWTEKVHVQAGQFFVYYDHENLQPSWGLQLVDRSIINANLGFERDVGIRFHGNVLADRLHYDLYVMNGDGRNTLNANDDFIYGARLDYQLSGSEQTILPELEFSAHPHLALGLAYLHDSGSAAVSDAKLNRFTADVTFRHRGVSALGLVNVAHNEDRDDTDYGLLAQAGYFVRPGRLEFAGRWAKIFRDGALGAGLTDPQEATVGVNYYLRGHQAKLQADYSRLWNAASTQDRDDDRVRVQMQLFF